MFNNAGNGPDLAPIDMEDEGPVGSVTPRQPPVSSAPQTAPVYAVRLRQPGEIRAWSGVTSVVVDAASGGYDPQSASPIGRRTMTTTTPSPESCSA